MIKKKTFLIINSVRHFKYKDTYGLRVKRYTRQTLSIKTLRTLLNSSKVDFKRSTAGEKEGWVIMVKGPFH